MSDTPRSNEALARTLDHHALGPEHKILFERCKELERELTALRIECEGLRVKVSEYEKALRWIDKYGGCSHPANFVSVARAALRKFDAAMNEGRSDEPKEQS